VRPNLLRGARHVGNGTSPGRVELGEDVVEQQHRICAVGTQEFIGGQSQGQRHRPRFAMGGETLGRLIAET
jgi:hypothetical protein